MGAKYKTLQDYWEHNIDKFSGFYDKNSEENIMGNAIIVFLYKIFIFPIEKKFMKVRYKRVKSYILTNIKEGMAVADIGCGSGIFAKICADLGAKVYALDFAQSALNITGATLSKENKSNVIIKKFDILAERIPKVDFCLAIGLLPYINDANLFLKNILPYTNSVLINFLDSNSILNRIRRLFSFINVRGYSYHSRKEIVKLIEEANFKVIDVKKLASGYIVEADKVF